MGKKEDCVSLSTLTFIIGILLMVGGGSIAWIRSEVSELKSDLRREIDNQSNKSARLSAIVEDIIGTVAENSSIHIQLYRYEAKSIIRKYKNIQALDANGEPVSPIDNGREPATTPTLETFTIQKVPKSMDQNKKLKQELINK